MRLFHVIVSHRPDPRSLLFISFYEPRKWNDLQKRNVSSRIESPKIMKKWNRCRITKVYRRSIVKRRCTDPTFPFPNSIRVHFTAHSLFSLSPRSPSSCSRSRLVNQRQDNAKGRHNGGCVWMVVHRVADSTFLGKHGIDVEEWSNVEYRGARITIKFI